MTEEIEDTAFNVMYGTNASPRTEEPAPICTPLPLNAAEREAIARSRVEAITVVSGPPGTGKSHLVAAAAIDEVARGQ